MRITTGITLALLLVPMYLRGDPEPGKEKLPLLTEGS